MAMPSVLAPSALRLMQTDGAAIEDFALVSVKAHDAGLLNPKARYRKKFTTEQVVNSRMISDPTTVLQCRPNTDGAAAIVLCSDDFARRHTTKPIRIDASVVLSGDPFCKKSDLTSLTFGHEAAGRASEVAGMGLEDLDVVEIHDAFDSEEMIHYGKVETVINHPAGGRALCFWGRHAVGVAADGRHHGEGQHDERDRAMPAMPGSCFLVVEPQFVLCGFEAVFDRRSMSFDLDQGFDAGSGRTPGGSSSHCVLDGQMERQHPGAQEFNACATLYGSLESFQSVDSPFGLAVAPTLGQGVSDRVDILPQCADEALHGGPGQRARKTWRGGAKRYYRYDPRPGSQRAGAGASIIF